MRYLFLPLLLAVTACASNDFQQPLDRLEFEEGEEGCLRAQGQVDAGSGWFATGSVSILLVKKTSDSAPDC